MGYDYHSEHAKKVARELGFQENVGFVGVLRRGKVEYVRASCGKPDEIRAFVGAATLAGFRPGPDSYWGGGHRFPRYLSRVAD